MLLFAYGTLEFPEIMEAVTSRTFPRRAAVLEGYRCRLLVGEVYPGIIESARERTAGTLYESLDRATLELLDQFEGAPYRRRRVRVRGSMGESVAAFAYVLPVDCADLLSDECWRAARFRAEDYAEFLESCRRFRREQREHDRAVLR